MYHVSILSVICHAVVLHINSFCVTYGERIPRNPCRQRFHTRQGHFLKERGVNFGKFPSDVVYWIRLWWQRLDNMMLYVMNISWRQILICEWWFLITLRWRHNEQDGVLNHQPYHCLLNRLFRRRSKKTSKLRVTGLCDGNSPGTGEFPTQMASNAENASNWWRHHDRQTGLYVHIINNC